MYVACAKKLMDKNHLFSDSLTYLLYQKLSFHETRAFITLFISSNPFVDIFELLWSPQ